MLNRLTYLHAVSPTYDRTKQRKLIGECEILESIHRLHHFVEKKIIWKLDYVLNDQAE